MIGSQFEGGDYSGEDSVQMPLRPSKTIHKDPSDLKIEGLQELKEHDDIFQNLTDRHYIDT